MEDEIVLLKAEKSGSEYGACHRGPNVEDGGPTPLKVRSSCIVILSYK